MNDIKLTDEEIINALDKTKQELANISPEDDDYDKLLTVKTIVDYCHDLIHSLQSENKELRTESDRMVAEHLAFVELAKKADEQQKAEIAELKAQCSKSSYRDSWKNKFFKANEEIKRLKDEKEEIKLFNLAIQNGEVDMRIESEMAKSFYGSIVQVFEQNGAKNFFTTTIDIEGKKGRYAFTIEKVGGQTVAEKLAEQKAEIERLTEELDLANETIDRNNKRYKKVSIERQKALDRVDFLEDALLDKIRRNEELITAIKQAEQQAVKDTAKDIATEILETKIKIGNEYYVFANNIKVIAKRKGVEVE